MKTLREQLVANGLTDAQADRAMTYSSMFTGDLPAFLRSVMEILAREDQEPEEKASKPAQIVGPEATALRDNFCIYPFESMNIMPAGTIKPCCAFNDLLMQDERPMTIYEYSLGDIWNSQAFRDLRRAFIKGENVPGCDGCFALERQGLESTRTGRTTRWAEQKFGNEKGMTIEEKKAEFEVAGYKAARGPEWLDLDVGNLCNLKCRMCNSTYSSRIAQDPVHSRWTGLPLLDSRWKNGELAIAPRPILGAAYGGFREVQTIGKTYTAFTNGRASIRVSAANAGLSAFSVKLNPDRPDNLPVEIKANGRTVFSGPVPKGDWEQRFDLFGINDAEINFVISSPLFKVSSIKENVGVGVDEVKLVRADTSGKQVFGSRFENGLHWFQESSFREDELLADPSSLKMLNFIGGEPLLIKEVRLILKRLIELGAAKNVMLVLTTNGTRADDEWFELCSHFKGTYVAVSVDGYSAMNDYIRFPSKWEEIDRNLPRFYAQPNTRCDLNVTVQAYNFMNISDLLQYCDDHGFDYRLTLLQYPLYLSPFIFPLSMRQEAARRIREYVTQSSKRSSKRSFAGRTEMLDCRIVAGSIASALEGGAPEGVAKHLRGFMQITNDLDRSRMQNIADVAPDLICELRRCGIAWSSDTRFFTAAVAAATAAAGATDNFAPATDCHRGC